MIVRRVAAARVDQPRFQRTSSSDAVTRHLRAFRHRGNQTSRAAPGIRQRAIKTRSNGGAERKRYHRRRGSSIDATLNISLSCRAAQAGEDRVLCRCEPILKWPEDVLADGSRSEAAGPQQAHGCGGRVHRRYDARVHTDLVPGHETVVKPTSPSKEAFEAAAWTVAHVQRIARDRSARDRLMICDVTGVL